MYRVRDSKGETIKIAFTVQDLIEYSKQHSYTVLTVQDKTVQLQFGIGVEPAFASVEFGNAKLARDWAALRIRNTQLHVKGQFISRETFARMEAARARMPD